MDQWSSLTMRPCLDLMRVAAALCPRDVRRCR
jgi:hypothetical protein